MKTQYLKLGAWILLVSALAGDKEGGLNTARAVLGHRTVNMTALYAELDRGLAVEMARRIG